MFHLEFKASTELDIATAVVANVTNFFFSLVTNFPCFSLIEILFLMARSENLGGQLGPAGPKSSAELYCCVFEKALTFLDPVSREANYFL